jgi:hypothetical protein
MESTIMRILGTVLIAAGLAGWLLSMPTASTEPVAPLPQQAPVMAPESRAVNPQPVDVSTSTNVRPAADEAVESDADAEADVATDAFEDDRGSDDDDDWSDDDEE